MRKKIIIALTIIIFPVSKIFTYEKSLLSFYAAFTIVL